MNTVSELTTLVHTGDIRIDSLLDSVSPWNFLLPYRNTLYYTFDTSDGSYIDGRTSTELTEFNTSQQDAVRGILGYVSGLIGVNFVEVGNSSAADIHFGTTDLAGGSNSGLAGIAYSYSHSNGNLISLTADSTIWLDNAEFAGQNTTPVAGNPGYETLLHEVGHMLGLGHTFNAPNTLPTELDNTNNTVMSYTAAGAFKSGFQQFDLWALTWIYGGDGLAGQWGYNSVNGLSLDPDAEDIIPPTVENFTPADDASGVDVNAQIEITFDEPVTRGSGNITLKTAGGQTVEVFDAATSPQLAIASAVLTVTPSSPLAQGTEYRLEFDTGSIEDEAGNPFAGTTSYNFTTVLPEDDTAPEIDGFSPADGSGSVALDSDLAISFNENIAPGNGTLVLRTEGGTTIASWDLHTSQNFSISGDTLTLELSQLLDYSTHYILEIPGGSIEDLSGNDFSGSSSYDFTTRAEPDTTAPLVTQFSPADDSASVSIDSVIRVYFDESINPGAGSITLQTASGTSVETFDPETSNRLDFSTNRLTIHPTSALDNSTEYRLILEAGAIEDLAGNPIAAIDHYNFTTKAADAPADDFADNPTTTGEVPINGQINGELEVAGDSDWFKLILSDDEIYQFELLGTGEESETLDVSGTVRLALLNSDEVIELSSTDGGVANNPLITFKPNTPGTFFLSVDDGNGTETGSYLIRASSTSNSPVQGELVTVGEAIPNQSLTVETQGLFDENGMGPLSYQWQRDGVDIEGATLGSYVLTDADINTAIRVEVSFTDGDGFDELILSEARFPIADNSLLYLDLIEMYVVIPGRAPDAGGLGFWSGILDSGEGFNYIAGEMWGSPQTQALYPPEMSSEGKVTAIYNNVLAREPDEEGLLFWTEKWNEAGPVDTMLEMIETIKGYAGDNQEGLIAKQLFMHKVDIGAYLAITHENDDLDLAADAYAYLSNGHSLEETIIYVDQQLENIGQSSIEPSGDLLS